MIARLVLIDPPRMAAHNGCSRRKERCCVNGAELSKEMTCHLKAGADSGFLCLTAKRRGGSSTRKGSCFKKHKPPTLAASNEDSLCGHSFFRINFTKFISMAANASFSDGSWWHPTKISAFARKVGHGFIIAVIFINQIL